MVQTYFPSDEFLQKGFSRPAVDALRRVVDISDALSTANSAQTATTALAAIAAPLDSPVFTGTPEAPTPAPIDNSTALATTAFVQAHTGGVYAPVTITRTGMTVNSSLSGIVNLGPGTANLTEGNMLVALVLTNASTVTFDDDWTQIYNPSQVLTDTPRIAYRFVRASDPYNTQVFTTTTGYCAFVFEVAGAAASNIIGWGSRSNVSAAIGSLNNGAFNGVAVPQALSTTLAMLCATGRAPTTPTIGGLSSPTTVITASDASTTHGGGRTATALEIASPPKGGLDFQVTWTATGNNTMLWITFGRALPA